MIPVGLSIIQATDEAWPPPSLNQEGLFKALARGLHPEACESCERCGSAPLVLLASEYKEAGRQVQQLLGEPMQFR